MPHIDLSLDGLPEDQPIRVEAGDLGICVVRTALGVVAYEDSCPHAQWRLSLGEVFNGRLECPGHGWEFEVATGQCVTVPAHCLRAMKVEVREAGTVRVAWDEHPAQMVGSGNR
jgi:nitrite reductase/ring-hydroxylating ferredoxin subunit